MHGGEKGRVPPHHLEAERSVLGAILVRNDTLDQVREVGLQTQDFYQQTHRKIYDAACTISDRSEPVDLVTLSAVLRDRGVFDAIGGTEALTSLFDDAFAVGNISYYARIIRDKAIQRRMIEVCTDIMSQAFAGVENTEEFLDAAESRMFSVADLKLNQSFVALKKILMLNMNAVEELALSKKDVTGPATGFKEFDSITTGLHPGQVAIIAARPGMGKTSWVLSAIQNAAVNTNAVVGFFSLEMSKEEIGFRFLSALSRIDSKKLKVGRLADRDWQHLAEAADKLAKARIFIDDSGGLTIMDIRARCRRLLAREKRLDLVVVDYLQLMQGSKHARGENSRNLEISEISRSLKELAKELKLPIIALSQLNRGAENRQDKRPNLADLRESGSIEQDADMVCFIYRDEYYNKDTDDRGIAELIISKNRSGPTDTIRLTWLAQYTLFVDLAENMPGAPVENYRRPRGATGYDNNDITL